MCPPASQCRRALQRQIPQHNDSVWVSDGLLASAFERYCRVSRTWNRNASNVPGPLESRRRLGRRRMAEASTWHGPPTPPPWAFLGPLNLTQWTWQPPSLARDPGRTQPRHDAAIAIAAAAAEPTALQPRLMRGGDDVPTMPSLTSAVSPGPSTEASAKAPALPYADVMGDFRRTAMHPDDAAFVAATNRMCGKFRQKIILGEISLDDIISLSTEIRETLDSRLQGSPMCHRLFLSLCRAVMSGLTASRVITPSTLDLRFWGAFLAQISQLPADDTLCSLMANVVKAMPAVHRPNLSYHILALLARFFSAWDHSPSVPEGRDIRRLLDISILGAQYDKPHEVSALPACLRQARVLSEPLLRETPEETKELLSAVQRLVLNEVAKPTGDGRALRYSWLYLLAQIPHVNEDYLFDAAAALSAPSLNMQPLSTIEVSSLLLTQWISRGYLMFPDRIHRAFRRHRAESDEAALASLFIAVFYRGKSETRNGLYRSVWKFLSKINQPGYVMQSLTLDAHPGMLPVRMLEALATASGDHREAIRLRDLWYRRIKTSDQPEWYPGTFGKYATEIINDEGIPAKEIWRMLDINKLERKGTTFRTRAKRHRNRFGRSRAVVVERMAQAFLEAEHLSNRAALRHVTRCFAFLRVVRGAAPDHIVWGIYNLVTRDLWAGRPGRTRRLLWFLRLLERRTSVEVSWAARRVLLEWRRRLFTGTRR